MAGHPGIHTKTHGISLGLKNPARSGPVASVDRFRGGRRGLPGEGTGVEPYAEALRRTEAFS
ncbi:hypothetical protein NITMOv2_2511 [Nitrospira moscoviensis]|uniref:Uncharacterized protein n=1 Tax=Nitrospira moscoviensis TaxID=42253 RepID=A0A0K2GDK5_NITMO|nr:hypothetical protein NITMOv2_2511 [Nitrospira moscoviensis]